MHSSCQRHYGDERAAAAVVRRSLSSDSSSSSQSLTPLPVRHEEEFDFKNSCFICTEKIPENVRETNQRVRLKQRIRISTVKSFSAVKKSMLSILKGRNDQVSQSVIARIREVSDDVGAGARYHHKCWLDLKVEPKRGVKRRRSCENIEEIVDAIYNYMLSNDDDCQFKLSDITHQIEGAEEVDFRTIKKYLINKYRDNIVIFERPRIGTFICLTNAGAKILSDSFYKEKKGNPAEERSRVVEEAAGIILEDIRGLLLQDEFPPIDDFMKNIESTIPQSLKVFLRALIMKYKCSTTNKWETICTTIAHAIMTAVRPRRFHSPLQLGVATFLYRKFASKHLIDILSAFGFCSSYNEVLLFESCCIENHSPKIGVYGFSQFVFDNSDFNVNTIDGHNTFHVMGGIQCVTPSEAVSYEAPTSRKSTKLTAAEIAKFGHIPIETYENRCGPNELCALNINSIRPINLTISPTLADFLWLYGKWTVRPDIGGWNGFMQQVIAERSFKKTRVIPLPVIDAPPSKEDTIYTALRLATEKCKDAGQKGCVVTFDLPLFMKAHDIISGVDSTSPVGKIVLRLGGFHLLMSFLGSIGNIMDGSGLTELLQTIYAGNSVVHILSGHAYSRAVRGHTLVHQSLAKMILDSMESEFTEEEREELDSILSGPERSYILAEAENPVVEAAYKKFENQLKVLEELSPTGRLWIQYFRMVTLMKNLIEAERSGNWNLHLDTIQKMLPYFHASGHFLYAKAAHIYLQRMMDLQDKFLDFELQDFVNGFFTMHFTDKSWSGIMSDMVIEQRLNRPMKVAGGLTQGRGINSHTTSRWILGMISMLHVCDEVENFCGVFSATTEQHVDARPSRIVRDNSDSEKLDNWLSERQPFIEACNLRSLSTGAIGDSTINCHLCDEVGAKMLNEMIGRPFATYKFQRKKKVLPLAAITKSIRVDNNAPVVPVQPLLLFQRMTLSENLPTELKEILKHELAPYPMSLFTQEGMRHGTKSTLYDCFLPLKTPPDLGPNPKFIVDGGFLLHRVVWGSNVTYSDICQKYVAYTKKHYGTDVVIVFDGYPEDISNFGTKSAERLRRSQLKPCVDIIFTDNMTVTATQDKFLGNESNKTRFISLLKTVLIKSDIEVEQAVEDADGLIISTAKRISQEYSAAVVIGEDVDLLVLLTATAGACNNIYLRKPGRGKSTDATYSPYCLKPIYGPNAAKNLLFLHAISGCDTTSAPFNLGKMKTMTALQKSPDLVSLTEVFLQDKADKTTIASNGEQFILNLYRKAGDTNCTNLNELRYKGYKKMAGSGRVKLESLPPTSDAAFFHSLRCFYQVQYWLENYLEPEEWGWRRTPRGLEPITMSLQPAPDNLLRSIACKCKTNCGKACGCRKAGLFCSVICNNCQENYCSNMAKITDDDDLDVMDEDDVYPDTVRAFNIHESLPSTSGA